MALCLVLQLRDVFEILHSGMEKIIPRLCFQCCEASSTCHGNSLGTWGGVGFGHSSRNTSKATSIHL